MSYSVGPDGWSIFTQHAGDKIYYVDSTRPNDSGGGLSTATAFKTVGAAITQAISDGMPSSCWILLREGKTWTGTDGQIGFGPVINGRSTSELLMFGSYDPATPTVFSPGTGGVRPIIDVPASIGNVLYYGSGSTDGNYIGFCNLDFHCYDRDFSDSRFDTPFVQGPTTINSSGHTFTITPNRQISILNTGVNTVYYKLGSSATTSDTPISPHRNAFAAISDVGSNTQLTVIAASGQTSTVILQDGATIQETDCLHFMNTSSLVIIEGCRFSSFSHGILSENNLQDIRVRRCSFVDNYGYASDGMALFYSFAAAELTENLFDRNGCNENITYFTAAFLGPLWGSGATNHSLYLDGGSDTVPAASPVCTRNIITNDVRGSHARCGGQWDNNLMVESTAVFDFGRPRTSTTYSITNNVFSQFKNPAGLNEGDPGFAPGGITLSKDYLPDNLTSLTRSPVTVTNNIFTTNGAALINGNQCVTIDPATSGEIATVTNNVVYAWGLKSGRNPFLDLSSGIANVIGPNQIYDAFDATWNTTTSNGSGAWSHPGYTVADYAGSVGLTASLDAFVAAARGQRKGAWDTRYTAAAANDYIRAGFGMTLLGSGNPSIYFPFRLYLRLHS